MKLYRIKIEYPGIPYGMIATIGGFRTERCAIRAMKTYKLDKCYNTPDAQWSISSIKQPLFNWLIGRETKGADQ